ncbi:MAG: hypothetical protein V4670_10590 [Bacteroidota bacterium]
MKTIYFLLVLSLTTFSTNAFNNNPEPVKSAISGLKIVSYESQKNGKHIYIVSDLYTKKKITFYNEKGEKVYTKATIGSPIYLSKFKKGKYTVKIKEDKKTEFKEITIE